MALELKIKTNSEFIKKKFKRIERKFKSIIEKVGDAAKDHFNKNKSYTNKSTEDMRKMLKKWDKKNTKTVAVAAEASSKAIEEVNEVVNEVEDWKEVKPNELITEMRNIQKQWVEDFKKRGVSYAERIEWIYEPDFNEQDNFVNYSYEVFLNIWK